jgi:hypothetical protein
VTKPKPDFLAILQALTAHRVDFIVVGGVAAVLHGAPLSTFDLDLVHSREPANIDRLLTALETLGACYRTRGAVRMKPNHSHLSSPGHQLLMTRSGPLDLLGVIGSGRGYDKLLGDVVELEVGGGLKVRVLDLAALIETKEETAREKDKAVLAILRRTLEERKKSAGH